MNKFVALFLLAFAGSHVGSLADVTVAKDTFGERSKHGRRRSKPQNRRRSDSPPPSARRRRRSSAADTIAVPSVDRVAKLERELKQVRDMLKLVNKPDGLPCMGKRERDACHVKGFNQSGGIMIPTNYDGVCIKRHWMRRHLWERFDDCSMLELGDHCQGLNDRECTQYLWGFMKEFRENYLYCAPTCTNYTSMECRIDEPDEVKGCRWWNPQENKLMEGQCRRIRWKDNAALDKYGYCVEERLLTTYCERSPTPNNTNCH